MRQRRRAWEGATGDVGRVTLYNSVEGSDWSIQLDRGLFGAALTAYTCSRECREEYPTARGTPEAFYDRGSRKRF